MDYLPPCSAIALNDHEDTEPILLTGKTAAELAQLSLSAET